MSKEREIIKGFTEEEIHELMYDDTLDYGSVKHTITSCDEEDGGADNYLVIQRKSDKKYFHAQFTDWEYKPDGHSETDDDNAVLVEFEECFPKQITITEYV